jgi:hypothetical protein
MKTNRYEIGFLLAVCAMALVALTCGTPTTSACTAGKATRTGGCDEFTRMDARVYKNSVEHTASGWYPLVKGDELSTDTAGQAEVNLSDCYNGHIFIFRASGGAFHVENCTKTQYPSSGYCDAFGTWYVGACANEFNPVYTGSGKIVKTGTTFSVTYLPENREITLVVALDGRLTVEPVQSVDPTELAPADPVAADSFYFTMPDDRLDRVAGLEPRQEHPITELAPVAFELGIQEWMIDISNQARRDGVLPPDWPADLGGAGEGAAQPPSEPPSEPGGGGIVVTLGGGPLADSRVAEGMLHAVDWTAARDAAAPDGGPVQANLPNGSIDLLAQMPFDPEAAQALFDEAGYERDQPVTILFPEEDEQLGRMAELVAKYLGGVNVGAEIQPVPAAEIVALTKMRMQAGEPVLALVR